MQDRKFRIGLVNRVSGQAIPEDEPVFIFRARDRKALAAILYYRGLCDDEHHRAAITETIEAFEEYQRTHPETVKEPGITHDFTLRSR
jgi:hypothetical protein